MIDGATLQATGASSGSAVTLQYDTVFQGRPVHVEYSGSVQADGSLKGNIKAGQSTGAFTAARS